MVLKYFERENLTKFQAPDLSLKRQDVYLATITELRA